MRPLVDLLHYCMNSLGLYKFILNRQVDVKINDKKYLNLYVQAL